MANNTPDYFNGKKLMITGGTGSFGTTVLKRFLTSDIGEIRIFSRDEKSRMIFDMNCKLNILNMQKKSDFTLEM